MKNYKLAFFILFIVILSSIILWNITKSRTFQFFGNLYSRIETSEKVIALTFDDGPTVNTDMILEILDNLNVKATFYVTGIDLEKNMDEGKKIVNSGHELGNHTYSHERMVLKSLNFVRQEIEKTDSLIKEAGYQGEITFRPPFGKKLIFLPYYLKRNNRKTIMWDIEPESYLDVANSSENITNHVLANVKPGSIILLHIMFDSRFESLKSIEGIVTGLRQNGYTFKTVSELLEK